MAFADPSINIQHLHLPGNAIVADIGAGSGLYSFAAGKILREGGKVYAIDIQKELLDKIKSEGSKQKILNIEVIWGDADEVGGTRLRENSVDAAIISNLLFQSEHKQNLAKEASRIVRPKGKLLLIDWRDSFGGLGPKQGDVVSPREAETLFSSAGFKRIEEFDAGDHHYGFIFQKE